MNSRLGATPRDDGCHFRVWAPHAEQVCVLLQTGDRWRHTDPTDRVCLSQDDHGYWNGFAPGIQPGRLYRYEIENEGFTFQRLDAAARDTIHSQLTRDHPASENASIVVTDRPYPWSRYRTPRFENFLIECAGTIRRCGATR